jgi:hypothetical protein
VCDDPDVRYYDLDGANARLEEVRPLLERLRADRDAAAAAQRDLTAFRESDGDDEHAAEVERREEGIRALVHRMQADVAQLEAWDVTLRDIGSGLIDFPALAGGRPIWLCWRLAEDDVRFWHRQDEGFVNRKPITELPVDGSGPVS